MSKKEFQKVSGQIYALGIQHGQTEEQMLHIIEGIKEDLLSKFKNKVNCGSCGTPVALIKHINRCECGARIKVLE